MWSWSLAYKAALWARLDDGNHSWKLVHRALFLASGMDIRPDSGVAGSIPIYLMPVPRFQD